MVASRLRKSLKVTWGNAVHRAILLYIAGIVTAILIEVSIRG